MFAGMIIHTNLTTVSPAELEVSELQRKNVEALNALTWTRVDGGITTSVDHLSPINLRELILPFPLSGLYETRMDNRTMTRTLTLYDAAIKRLEPYGFHKARAASRATLASVSPRIENEQKRRDALKELNQVDAIGQYVYRWKRSPHRENGIQLDIPFSDKAAAENFAKEYLVAAGALKVIVEPRVIIDRDPVTQIYGILHSQREWQIALDQPDIAILADDPPLDEAKRLYRQIVTNIEASKRGGYRGRG